MDANNVSSPLISIVVATYNSSATILETLESIKDQTYHNIELIVTDDCSTDETKDICQKWLSDNQKRFVCSELVLSPRNTGTSGNFNRGIKRAHGDWIKSIAGDDRLKSICIERFILFVKENNCEFCICDLSLFNSTNNVPDHQIKTYQRYFACVKEPTSAKKKRIIHEMKLPGPGYFFSKRLFTEIGGFDERYIIMEEWPFVYFVLKRGYDILPVDEKLVDYRVSANSISHKVNNGMIDKQWFIDQRNFFFDYLWKDLVRHGFILKAWSKTVGFWISTAKYENSHNFKISILRSLRLFDVYFYLNRIKKLCQSQE